MVVRPIDDPPSNFSTMPRNGVIAENDSDIARGSLHCEDRISYPGNRRRLDQENSLAKIWDLPRLPGKQ